MIKFLDLQAINLRHRSDIEAAMSAVLDSGWYVLGEEVSSFESEFAEFCGTDFCIGVSSGLSAIELILEGYIHLGKIQKGDEVIVPANTYIASIIAITRAGLTPILIEPNEETYNLCPIKTKAAITAKTKAVLAVHLYGRVSEMVEMNTLCKECNLLLLEDGAQAHGAQLNGLRTGAWGDAAAFSFYPGKNLGALGDGGAVTTSDKDLETFLRAYRNYGSEKKYHNQFVGRNERLDEIQAAVLRKKLLHLNDDNKVRREHADLYNQKLTDHPYISIPAQPLNLEEHVWHLYTIRTAYREQLQAHLLEHGVQTMIHYPIPSHKQVAYKELNKLSLPITEQIHEEILSLPLSPVQSQEVTYKVIESCLTFSPKN